MVSKRLKALRHSISLEQSSPTVLVTMESMRSMYQEGVLSDEDVWDAAKKKGKPLSAAIYMLGPFGLSIKKYYLKRVEWFFQFHSLQVTFLVLANQIAFKKNYK